MSTRLSAPLFVCAVLAVSCSGGGSGGGATTTTTTVPPSGGGSCAASLQADSLEPRPPSGPKPVSTDDRRTRRGRVYEQLWKHQAAPPTRVRPQTLSPAATTEDIGHIAVVRDEGDIVLSANPFDLKSIAVAFVRNGSGGYDVRRSDRTFQSAAGQRLSLDDDASVRVALPASVPFYAGRFNEVFVNSDGNLTFVTEEHASTDRDVARFLTGPPRIALLFDDLDPAAGGGVFTRADGDALLVTWCNVPEFDAPTRRVTAQLRIGGDGTIDFIYGTTVDATTAIVGVSPGETGIFAPVNVSTAASSTLGGGSGAVGERFSTQTELDFVALGRKFYQTHGDDFDQFVVFTNTATVKPGTFAFEFTVANEVTGIGVNIFNASRDFGSAGRLRSIVQMDRLSRYPDDPRQRFLRENNTLSLLGQECGHRWLAFLEFRDGSAVSNQLLGRDEAHWSFLFDSDGSHMEGNDISDLGNGQFRTVGAVSRYSALDQYAMGLRAASEVPPMFLVTGVTSGQSPEDPPSVGADIRGTRKDVRIEDIVAAMGARRPDTATSQKAFREAFIFVVAGTRETSAEIAKLDRIRTEWEAFFAASVENRGSMSTRLR